MTSRMKNAAVTHVQVSQNHMATVFNFRISAAPERVPAARWALEEAHAWVSALESELSEFDPKSPVFRLNSSPAGERVEFTERAFELLQESERLARTTQGCFSHLAKSRGPAIGLLLDSEARTVSRAHEGVHLSFGAIGKGYALDQVRALLEREGFSDYLLSAGGSSILLSGFAAPGEPWRWGWSWKKDSEGESLGIPLSHASGRPIALGISGTHEKGFHLWDPVTQKQLLHPESLSTLVATPSATWADALSTALFVGGMAHAQETFDALPSECALARIGLDETPEWNGSFQKWFGAIGAVALAAVTLSVSARAEGAPEDAVDLATLGSESFTPYSVDRHPGWVALPLLAIALVLIHLKKTRRKSMKRPTLLSFVAAVLLWGSLQQAHAVEIEPIGKALLAVLGTPKAFKKSVGDQTVYYSKNAQGKPERFALIQKNVYPPNCTHTWVVGLDSQSRITEIRVNEMSCPHALPAKQASFLDQYKGKGPADTKTLKGQIHTIAKATGTCDLATEAAVTSIQQIHQWKGSL